MNVSEKPVFHFVVSRAILFAIGSLLLCIGGIAIFKEQQSVAFGGSLLVLGGILFFLGLRSAAEIFRGKPVFEKAISLSLPGSAAYEVTIPSRMRGGRVILFFEDTTERYAGKVTLSKNPVGDTLPVSVSLPRLEPSRMKIPKWLPTSDAGEVFENWPRRTGQSTEPVLLAFSFPVEIGEGLNLEFELESNFKGTKLERRFPITGKETVRVIVKE